MIGEEQINPIRRKRKRSTREKLREQRGDGIRSGAVQAGLIGGKFRPLSEYDMQRIHATALDVLEQIGIGEPIPSIVEAAIPKGAALSGSGRLCFPRSLMEDLIDGCCKRGDGRDALGQRDPRRRGGIGPLVARPLPSKART